MFRQTLTHVGGMILVAVGVAGPLHAAEYQAYSQIQVGGVYENTVNNIDTDMVLSQVTDHGSTGGIDMYNGSEDSLWTGRASAQSGPGYLRTFAQMHALLFGSDFSYNVYGNHRVEGNQGTVDFNANWGMGFTAEARAYLRDTVTVSAPGLEGAAGTLRMSINVSGQVLYQHSAVGVSHIYDSPQAISADTAIILNGQYQDFGARSYFGWSGNNEPLHVNQPAGGTATFDIPITFGEAFDLELQLFSQASLGVYAIQSGMFAMLANFNNTAVLGGVSVLDEENTAVATANVLGNNFNYDQSFTAPPAPSLPDLAPIPEPSSMAVLGLSGLWMLRRRRSGDRTT